MVWNRAIFVPPLMDIVLMRRVVPVDQVIPIVRAAVRDASPLIRTLAMSTVAVRTVSAHWAGTAGPGTGRRPSPVPNGPAIPADWKDDHQRLRNAVYDDCSDLLKDDADREVRYYAFFAVSALDAPATPGEPIPERLVTLLVGLFRNDPDIRLRVQAVKALALLPVSGDVVRLTIQDALADPEGPVRDQALAAITPQLLGGPPKLSFDEAQATILAALEGRAPGPRLGAVRALNLFGAAVFAYIPRLRRMQELDADPQVRKSARLAIDAIERARRELGK